MDRIGSDPPTEHGYYFTACCDSILEHHSE